MYSPTAWYRSHFIICNRFLFIWCNPTFFRRARKSADRDGRLNTVKCCSFVSTTIGFLDSENVGLAVKINVPAYLEAEILQNVNSMVAIL